MFYSAGFNVYTDSTFSVQSRQTKNQRISLIFFAPRTGFEPVTSALTALRSTTELPRNIKKIKNLQFQISNKMPKIFEIVLRIGN